MEGQGCPQDPLAREVLVLGWYGHQNLGDEAFKDAFQSLWPQVRFTWCNRLPQDLTPYQALWVGGGSFLDHACPELERWTGPLGFIGVGLQDKAHPDYLQGLRRAKAIVARNIEAIEICPSARVAPDLVFGLELPEMLRKRLPKKRVTVFLNDFVTPRHNSPDWHTRSYLWFQHEFAKACDDLVKQGYELHFMPMGLQRADDRKIAAAVISRMELGHSKLVKWYTGETTELTVRASIAMSEFVITQRFHGIVFAVQNGCPFIAISAHDKLKSLTKHLQWPGLVNYYGFNLDTFNDVRRTVERADPGSLLDYSTRALEEWKCISATVEEQFFGLPSTPQPSPTPRS